MRDAITTALDVLGILAVACGLVFGLWAAIGPFALAVGGLALFAASRVSEWTHDAAAAPRWWRKLAEAVAR